MTDLKLPPPPANKQLAVALPENINLLQWMAIIKASDYFLGCDSVGQHFANALSKPATVVIGATFPENISYPDNKDFTIIDCGKDKRTYSPIRITMDHFIERSNEELMVLNDDQFKRIIKSVTDKLGKSSQKNVTYNPVTSGTTDVTTQSPTGIPFQKSTVANLLENTKV
jgi:ADP-heptose:LPS heptosyltransferase